MKPNIASPSLIDEHSTLNDGLGEGVSYRLAYIALCSDRINPYIFFITPGCSYFLYCSNDKMYVN
jgi:hypothetical protein